MSIYGKARKMLWGLSGSRCALCKRELVVEATSLDNDSIVGEECHIVSGQPAGPRQTGEGACPTSFPCGRVSEATYSVVVN